MPFYQQRGIVPLKRHTQFRDNRGHLFWEEHISRGGFSSTYSNVYHLHPPTAVSAVGDWIPIKINALTGTHRSRHVFTGKLSSRGDAISARIPLFFNQDVQIHKAHVDQSMDTLYRNGHHDEVLFIQTGEGKLMTNFGILDLMAGDYVVIPRGIIWQMTVQHPMRILVIESVGPVETPTRYRNRFWPIDGTFSLQRTGYSNASMGGTGEPDRPGGGSREIKRGSSDLYLRTSPVLIWWDGMVIIFRGYLILINLCP